MNANTSWFISNPQNNEKIARHHNEVFDFLKDGRKKGVKACQLIK